jgi:hypothetical protein
MEIPVIRTDARETVLLRKKSARLPPRPMLAREAKKRRVEK